MLFDKAKWMQMPHEIYAGHDVLSKIGGDVPEIWIYKERVYNHGE